MPLREDYENDTPNLDTHPLAHNQANDVVNTLQGQVAGLRTDVDDHEVKLGPDPGGVYADVTTRAGALEFTRGVGGMGVVAHGASATFARPVLGYHTYIWIGTVAPDNAVNNDIWLDTAP